MQTNFSAAQLEDLETARSEKAIRACVHCGFCTATCPTYALLGDELDSPRGRIVLMKEMLENGEKPTAEVVKHIDRCLSCLSCTTTCPSGVDYMHLIDHTRAYIEKNYDRPLTDGIRRAFLAATLPSPMIFRLLMLLARVASPLAPVAPKGMAGWLRLAPTSIDMPAGGPRIVRAKGPRRGRIGVLEGCVQRVAGRRINEATIRFFARHGFEVVRFPDVGCCGALAHHLGKDEAARRSMRAAIAGFMREAASLDAIAVSTSGCGTTVKDYGTLFADDPAIAAPARTVSALARDVSELVDLAMLKNAGAPKLRVAYHAACSLQHGQKIRQHPKTLLAAAGFEVLDIAESHLCCGSAGVYNLLQPEIADALRERKVANIARTRPDVIASGNLGCLTQIGVGSTTPVAHTIELLDWATGGPRPKTLKEVIPL